MTTREDRMARAGDYVLGLMDETARERAERDMMTDAEFRDCVALLAVRMRALDGSAGADAIPDGGWSAIGQRIAQLPQMRGALTEATGHEATGHEATGDETTGDGAAAGATRPRPKPHAPRPYAPGGGRGMALAALMAAALGIGYLGGRATDLWREPVAVAVPGDGHRIAGGVLIETFAGGELRIVPLADFEVPPEKALEIWTFPAGDSQPVSLGTFRPPREIRLQGPDLPVPQARQLYRITLEDAAGPQARRPTGPVLAEGRAVIPAR